MIWRRTFRLCHNAQQLRSQTNNRMIVQMARAGPMTRGGYQNRHIRTMPTRDLVGHVNNVLVNVFDREEYRRSIPSEWSHLPLRLKWFKPGLFFLGTSLGIFAAAAYLTNRDTDMCLSASIEPELYTLDGNETLRMLKQAQAHEAWVTARLNGEESGKHQFLTALRHPILFLRANARPEAITLALLLPLTITWHVPGLRPSLFRHWTHSFRSRKSYTTFTAMFSHQLPFQWFNLFAACSTIPLVSPWFMHAVDGVQHESLPWFHFTSFCLTAGMFSFLAPQWIAFLRFRAAFQQLARGIPGPYTSVRINKSLSYGMGVSGIIHACLTLIVCANPNIPVLTLVPEIPRGAFWASICAVESICMFFLLGNIGWASNLSGVAFGAMYSSFGPSFWISLRTLMHRVQFPEAWELKSGVEDKNPYPGKYLSDSHPLFKRSFGEAMGWNSSDA